MVGGKCIVLLLELFRSEVVDIEPVVVPRVQFGLFHLLFEGFVGEFFGVAHEREIGAALDDGLAFAEDCELAVETVPDSELLRD